MCIQTGTSYLIYPSTGCCTYGFYRQLRQIHSLFSASLLLDAYMMAACDRYSTVRHLTNGGEGEKCYSWQSEADISTICILLMGLCLLHTRFMQTHILHGRLQIELQLEYRVKGHQA